MKRTGRRGPLTRAAWIAAVLLLAGSWWNPRGTGALPVPVHFDPAALRPTPLSMTITGYLTFGGALPGAGAELAAFDPDEILCGVSGVDPTSGAFILHVYGDDPVTSTDEGATAGEILTLRAYEPLTRRESSGTDLTWSALLPLFTDRGSFPRNVDGPGEPDSDADGVPDATDACPATPVGVGVDASGCSTAQRDTDSDGIVNGSDAFPTDPAASEDTDGDGFPDAWNVGYTQADSTTGLVLDQYPGNPYAHEPPPTPVVASATLADDRLVGPLVLRFSPYEGTTLAPARVWVDIDDATEGGGQVLSVELPTPGYPTQLPLAPGVLLAGQTYQVQVQHMDATVEWSAWSTTIPLAVPAFDLFDTNGDGVQDSAEVAGYTDVDQNGVDDRTQAGLVVVAEAQSGTGQPVGLAPSAGILTALYMAGTESLPANQQLPSDLELPYGVFSFRVDGLTPGQDVDMTFHLPAPLPAGTRWLKLDPIDGLEDLTDRATILGNRVVVRLTEGVSPYDADRVENAVLIDPSGPATPISASPPSPTPETGGGGGGGCFVRSLAPGR